MTMNPRTIPGTLTALFLLLALLAACAQAPETELVTVPVVQLTAGDAHFCALTSAGAVYCWGQNDKGQLGSETPVPCTHRYDMINEPFACSASPLPVAGLNEPIVQVAAGMSHTCALTTSGLVYCWGANDDGQLGDGTTQDRRLPKAVSGLPGPATFIAAGAHRSCAVLRDGALYCWGLTQNDCQPTECQAQTEAKPIKGLESGVAQAAVGAYHACALKNDGTLFCWGNNSFGQLGDGSTEAAALPVEVDWPCIDSPVEIGAGDMHSCAKSAKGAVYCWGDSYNYWVGEPTEYHGAPLAHGEFYFPRPQYVTLAGIHSLAIGNMRNFALTEADAIIRWGAGVQTCHYPDKTCQVSPIAFETLPNTPPDISALSGDNGWHVCAATRSGAVYCWTLYVDEKQENEGQLGNGTLLDSAMPVRVEF